MTKKDFNPALLKLELFCRGMKIDSSCNLDKDARPVLRTRGGLGSGLEIMLPEKLYMNVPVEENFVKNSPYHLSRDRRSYYIEKNGTYLCDVTLPARPDFYDKKTSSGKLMSRIGVMQGTYLGIYPVGICEFWKMDPPENCKFCSVGLNLGCTEDIKKSPQDVLETALEAAREEHITFVHFNTGYLYGEELKILEPYIKVIKQNTGLLVGVQAPPAPDLEAYRRLKRLGVDHLSFCLELYDPESFKETCPGKHAHIGQRRYFEAISYCASLFGRGRVSGEIIAGLEAPETTIKAIEYFAQERVVSTVCVFRPCRGTIYESLPPPDPKELVPVFRRLYEVCLEKHIPISMVPNIKVSLVLLAEEGRYFIDKRNLKIFLAELQMAVVRSAFRLYFHAKLAASSKKRKHLGHS